MVSNSIPQDIITEEIYPKLPAKSLVRFKCVSKSSNTFISSPEFIDQHFRRSLSSDANRLLILVGADDSNLSSFDVDSPDSPAIKIPLPHSLGKWLQDGVSVLGSVNGLLCVGPTSRALYMSGKEFKHVVLNPFTGVYREIPHKSTTRMHGDQCHVSFGFGFDDINIDYKLVRVIANVQFDPFVGEVLDGREVMVYSLKENSWKLIEDVDEPSHSLYADQNGVLIKSHLLHWVGWGSNRYRIFCFDVRYDKWVNDVPLMELLTDRMNDYEEGDKEKAVYVKSIGVIDGCLCVSTSANLCETVWIMKEYGVKESWVKLFELSDSIGGCDFEVFGPFGFRQGSKHDVLARKYDSSGLFWCDIRSKTYGNSEKIKGAPEFNEAFFFKGSLVQIPGGMKIQE